MSVVQTMTISVKGDIVISLTLGLTVKENTKKNSDIFARSDERFRSYWESLKNGEMWSGITHTNAEKVYFVLSVAER